MNNFPVYYVFDLFLHFNFIFHFPAKNNFMLVTQRTERYGGETYLVIIFVMVVFPDCMACEYIIVM
jgi:hypothetical protein